MYSTNTVPGATNSLWALLCPTGTKISPYAPIQIKGFSITKNSAVYADYDMFASGLPIDVRIFKANQDTTQLDAVFHTTPNALTLRSNGASLTVFGTVSNCDFDLSSSVALRIVGNSTGRIAGGFVYEMTSSNVGLLTITYVKNLLSADMGTLSYSALLSTAGSSLVTLISNSVIAGGLSGSTISSISGSVFKNSISDCFIQNMSNCVISGFFFSNVCLGPFQNNTANNYYANTNYTTVSSCSFEATSLNIFFGTVSNSTLTGTVSNNKFFKNLASVTIGSGITYANNEVYAGFAGTTFVSVSLNRYTVADGTTFQPYAGLALINSQTNTQAAGMLTINSPLGTSDNGAIMKFIIKSTNSQYIKWNANYTASPGLILPFKTTGGNQTDYYTFQYNSAVGWILLSSTNEFTSVSTQNLNAVFSDGEVISYDNDMVFY